MGRNFHQMLDEFKRHWKNYVFQSLLASVTLAVIMLVLRLQNIIIVASMGSSFFVVFAMPKSITARPRNVIGGHLVGYFSGILCALIPHPEFISSVIVYSLAVGLSIFIMVVIDVEHPPASGTALGAVIAGFESHILVAIVATVILLSLVQYAIRDHIRDLI